MLDMIGLLSTSFLKQRDAARDSGSRSPTRWPWKTAIFFVLVFVFAGHDFKASQNWQAATATDVANLAGRVEEGRLARQVAFPVLACWGLFMILKPGGKKFAIDPWLLVPLTLFITWSFATLLWSHDRGLTVKRLVVFGSIVLAVIGFARQFRFRDAPFCILVGTLIMMLVGVVSELIYSPGMFKDGYRFAGSQHPNHTGINGMLIVLSSLYFFYRGGLKRFLLLAAFGFLIVVLTKSRTALLGGVAGTAVLLLAVWPRDRAIFVGILTGLVGSLFVGLYTAGIVPPVYEAVLMGRENADPATLTGRTDIWKAGFNLLLLDPTRLFTGMGYDSFWNGQFTDHISKVVRFKISESHNAYIDLIFDLGVIGLALWSLVLVMMVRSSMKRWASHGRAGRLAGGLGLSVVTFVLVHGIAESTFVDSTYPAFVALLLFGLFSLRNPVEARARAMPQDTGAA